MPSNEQSQKSTDPRSPEQLQAKIDELWSYDDYSHGPRGENLRYKHQGWIDALQWAMGQSDRSEP